MVEISLIHPELNVVNVDGTAENRVPEDVYVETESSKVVDETSILEKKKSFLRLK